MNMQQMIIQAQKMQRELQKAQNALKEKEFSVSKGGLVTVVVKGDKSIVSINIDKDAMSSDMKEMVEESIALAINEAVAQIEKESEEINEQITGRSGGMF
ncbi:MAG: YbaB/EbfC family nucleoid-associated protein [Bacilli bacterium]|nr:YbaB/EbfC family nucleoid-associated protein [Bacilli bacterium]